MYHNLYLVNCNTPTKLAKYHQVLFIEFVPSTNDEAARGSVYSVEGPKLQQEDKQFYLAFRMNKAPKHSSQYRSMKVIGRIRDSEIERFFDICESVTPPIVARTYNGESPNCCDWINNVLYRLKQQGIVEFNDDFDVPSREVSMNYKDWTTMAQGSSSKSGKPSSSKRSSKG